MMQVSKAARFELQWSIKMQSIKTLYLETFICFFLAFLTLFFLSNSIGFEGDDLNTVLPMLHLQDAKNGNLLIYRYYWQPLSYEIGSIVYNLIGNIRSIFLLPQICMALSISILYQCCVYELEFNRKLFLPLLMLFPEIIYTGLYFNSTAIAFPFICVSLLLAFKRTDWAGAAFTGIALSLAVMLRFDFILITPFIFIYRYLILKKLSDAIVGGLFLCVGLSIGVLTGVLVPEKIFEVYDLARQEIIERSSEPGWDLRTKLFVATTIFSPIGWAILAVATFWSLKTKAVWKPVAIGVICLMPMLLSARNILTPKYIMPVLAVASVLVVIFWNKTVELWSVEKRNRLSTYWVIITIGLMMFSVEPIIKPPFLKISTTDNREVGTHDGPRSWGSYLWQFRRVASITSKDAKDADELLAFLEEPNSQNIVLVGGENFFSPGGVAWRHLQIRLEREGFSGRVVEAGRIKFEVPSGTVTLSNQRSIETGACIVLLDEVSASFKTPTEWIKLNCNSS
jgi:hypothetical protein